MTNFLIEEVEGAIIESEVEVVVTVAVESGYVEGECCYCQGGSEE